MSEPHDDAALRARFAELQPARHAAAPALEDVLDTVRLRRRQASSIARRRALYAALAIIPFAGALAVHARDRAAAAREHAQLLADLETLAHFRSPTEDLLVDQSLAWLSVPPTIESVINVTGYRTTGGRP